MTDIPTHRLHNQQITQQVFRTPGEVVAWLGAVQAQEYAHAKWALGLRLCGVTDADVEQAFTKGEILRTHVMRPTWHFVTPADMRWLLDLTSPRVNALNAYYYRQLELDDALLTSSNSVIADALRDGQHLTRMELASALREAGIAAQGMRLGYIVHRAELDGIVCSGPRRGNQFTYALLDIRAPQAGKLSRDEALTELTKRYFTSHGPATIKDFAWWSGLTIADAKAGLQMAGGSLIEELIDGHARWYSPPTSPVADVSQTAHLLPPYDEYTIAYKDSSPVLDPSHLQMAREALFGGAIVTGGRFVGYWRRTISRKTVAVQLEPFRPLTAAEQDALAAAANRYGEYVGLPVVLS